jgi:O-antigen/teichoic acid export membrane protein
MSQVGRNVVANFIGRFWAAVIPIALVPLYIRFLGVEAYGLVGFYATLQSVCSLLDVGLGVTLTRELARLAGHRDTVAARELVRTFELFYWAGAILMGALVVAFSPVIARHWIKAQTLSPAAVQMAVAAMGIAIAPHFPLALYSGGLNGLERQVSLNVISIAFATVRGAGAVLILWLVSRTIEAFFIWQIVVGSCATLATAWLLWSHLRGPYPRPRARLSRLRGIWVFSLSVSGIGIAATILTQLDELTVSKLLPLETFSYYAVAASVALGLYTIVGPIFTALFPRLSQLVSDRNDARVAQLYHVGCQSMSIGLFPLTATIALFSESILQLWTHNRAISANGHVVLSILIVAVAANGLMSIPYATQLAYGWTSLTFAQNCLAVTLLIPTITWAVRSYGVAGAAGATLGVNTACIGITLPIMHRRLLRGELRRWYLSDVGLPLIASLLVCVPSSFEFRKHSLNKVTSVFWIGVTWLAAVCAAAMTSSAVRREMRAFVSRARGTAPIPHNDIMTTPGIPPGS